MFKGVSSGESLATLLGRKDRFTMYKINEKSQFVFKTSLKKWSSLKACLETAKFLCHRNIVFFFVGNHERVKHHATLATSAHHLLLCKHVVLVTMQGRQEDKENIEIFWQIFNETYKETNKDGD